MLMSVPLFLAVIGGMIVLPAIAMIDITITDDGEGALKRYLLLATIHLAMFGIWGAGWLPALVGASFPFAAYLFCKWSESWQEKYEPQEEPQKELPPIT